MPDEIVGRALELAGAEQLLERAAQSMAACVLEGDAGIGKTTVWQAAVDSGVARGWLVLVSRPAQAEQALGLGALTDLLGGVGEATLAGLPDPQRHALEVALLRVEPAGVLPDQRTLAVAVAGLLRRLATPERPVLLAIDDAQWVDETSAAILAYAIRRLADRPIGLLASVRAGAASAASDSLLAATPVDRLERIAVGPLRLASLHRLLETRLGHSVPRLVLVRIEEASRGNPLYALELARALDRAAASITPGAPLPVPDSLGSLVAARVAALPPATRSALLLAAAAADPALATLRAAGVAEPSLGPAISDGIVTIGHGVVRFAHPLFAQAVIAVAPREELEAAHRALAAVVGSSEARARHLGAAADAPDEAVAIALEQAAGAARDRGATLDAAALYQDSARLTPAAHPDRSLRRAMMAAECLFIDVSDVVQADAILEAALGDPRAIGPVRAEALSEWALIRYYHGRVPEAVDLGREALDHVGEDPVLRARVLGRAAFVTMQLDLEAGVAMVDEAVRLLECSSAAADPDLLANVLLLRAVGELGLVRPTRTSDIDRGLGLITAHGRSWEHEGADGSAFGIARLTDDLDRAVAMTRELVRSKSGPTGDDPFNLVMLSGLLLLRGDWAEARGVAEAALAAYEREGQQVHPSWGLRGVALVAVHDGRIEAARALSALGIARARERGDIVLEVFHRQILGFAALSQGQWRVADEELSAGAALGERIATRHPGRFKLLGDHVEALVALGELDRAHALVGRLDEAARIAPTPWVLAVGARCTALVTAAGGDLETAAAALERALDEHERLPMPFERARTLLVKGRLHRRRREKGAADRTLREALEIFEHLGAPVWAEQARLELARVGLRPRAPSTLTETELRVAALAAGGLSTRQIAEQAFLSPKTVGNVLGRVYEKLGIHSRAELGARMAAEGRVADR